MVAEQLFDVTGRHVVITGAAGLLGSEFARSLASVGAVPIILDIDEARLSDLVEEISDRGNQCLGFPIDVTDASVLRDVAHEIRAKTGPVWGLVNNVAANPPMGEPARGRDRFESFPLDQWNRDIEIGLSSALLCSQIFGAHMVERGTGSIVNIASDLAIIAPDHRVYRRPGLESHCAPVKPVSYSVVKAGIVGLTRYLATYWAPLAIRCNALLPGSVLSNQDVYLVNNLQDRIPLGRLANPSEYAGSLIFLLSDASSYMTGSSFVVDGGRSAW